MFSWEGHQPSPQSIQNGLNVREEKEEFSKEISTWLIPDS